MGVEIKIKMSQAVSPDWWLISLESYISAHAHILLSQYNQFNLVGLKFTMDVKKINWNFKNKTCMLLLYMHILSPNP